MTLNRLFVGIIGILFAVYVAADKTQIDSSQFWLDEASDYYSTMTGKQKEHLPSSILGMRCSTTRWTATRAVIKKWYNTKICCVDFGCCEESDKEHYPNIEAENCMRRKVRAKVNMITSTETSLSTFQHFKNMAISGHNREHLRNVSVDDCKRKCSNESWCKSFDYYKNSKRCDLSDKHYTQTGLKNDYPNHPFDHYSRQ